MNLSNIDEAKTIAVKLDEAKEFYKLIEDSSDEIIISYGSYRTTIDCTPLANIIFDKIQSYKNQLIALGVEPEK